MEANNNELAQIPEDSPFSVEKFKELTGTALDNLNANKTSRLKAQEFFEKLKVLPLDAKSDEIRKNYIEKCKTTVKTMKDRRTPFTQIMDAVKKMFTSEEAWLDNAIKEIQAQRNAFATQELKRQEEERRNAQKLLDIKNAKALLRQYAQSGVIQTETDIIQNYNNSVASYTLSLTINNIDTAQPEVDNPVIIPESIEPALRESSLSQLHPQQRILILNDPEVEEIINTAAQSFDRQRVITECMKITERVIRDMPALKKKLEEAQTDEKKAAEIKQQITEKVNADTELSNQSAVDHSVRFTKEVAASANTQVIQNQLDLSIATPITAVDAKTSKKIVILDKKGYSAVFAMWFEHEGSTMPDDKIQKMTIARMVTFCEKLATDKGTLISSPDITYQDNVVAK